MGPSPAVLPPKARPWVGVKSDVKVEDSDVKIEDLDGPIGDGDVVPIEITVSPVPPPPGSEERPDFVIAVREWLLNNFSKAEYEFIVS